MEECDFTCELLKTNFVYNLDEFQCLHLVLSLPLPERREGSAENIQKFLLIQKIYYPTNGLNYMNCRLLKTH